MNSRISFAWIMMCGLLLSSIAAAQEAPLKMNVWPGKAPGDSFRPELRPSWCCGNRDWGYSSPQSKLTD